MDSIRQDKGLIVIRFARNVLAGDAVLTVLRRRKGRITLAAGRAISLKVRAEGSGDEILAGLISLLDEIDGVIKNLPENAGIGSR